MQSIDRMTKHFCKQTSTLSKQEHTDKIAWNATTPRSSMAKRFKKYIMLYNIFFYNCGWRQRLNNSSFIICHMTLVVVLLNFSKNQLKYVYLLFCGMFWWKINTYTKRKNSLPLLSKNSKLRLSFSVKSSWFHFLKRFLIFWAQID